MGESSFGSYVRQRRRELDLTQEELARRVGCAAITIRKIEAEDARPSVQIAERLAMALAIPLDQRAEFVRRARAVRSEPDELPTPPPKLEEIGNENLTGRAIRGYALAERIGSGGMGAVYRAVQPNVEREVAIKIILPAFANHPDFIRRFEAEAQLVARLEHPHIVPLYDYWREPGVAYLVMRLLRGGSLQRLLQGGDGLPIETVSRLLEQICMALGSAHRIGVIHRDLKPANILLDEDQNAYLADFGIAKNLGSPEASGNTETGAILGSPQYISPEQIRSLAVHPQTDIYCLGIMLYEMLTGKVPFTGPTPMDLIQQHCFAPMPPLAAHSTGLPAALDMVIARATAKDPEERYTDTHSLLMGFRQALSGLAAETVFLSEEEPVTGEPANPYKGLRAFGEADADDFFGRETLVHQLLARLSEGGELARFLAVVGPSGSGKSSVVRAGLLPALRRGGLLGSENWFYVDMLPGAHPFEELEAALLRVAVNPPASLLDQLKDGDRGLLRAVNRILPNDPAVDLMLVIDQFEELFTLVENEQERALFMNSLVTACLDERSRVRILITLRADFIDQPLRFVDFGELLQRRNELVLPLTPDELESAIVGPAQRVGLKLEAGLTLAIIGDLGSQPGILPLMQYALTELFERREGRMLTKSGYQAIGGVSGALGRRAEQIFTSLEPEAQETARQMFLRLVTLGEGTEDTRRRVQRIELEALAQSTNQWITVIDAFGKARLLSFDRDPLTRNPTVEVAHEALLREWPRLKEWLADSRNDIRMQRLLNAETVEWLNNEREKSYLLTGARLSQFLAWAETSSVALTRDEKALLDASMAEYREQLEKENIRQQKELEAAQKLAETEKQRAEEQTRAARNIRRGAWGLSAALLLAVILAVFAIFQRQGALKQSSILLAGQAETELANGYYDRAVLLALEALENYPYTAQAERALGQAVSYNRAIQQFGANQSAVTSLDWSPDGNWVASSSSNDNNVLIWDPVTGKTKLVIDMPSGITGNKLDMALNVQWTPDGKQLLVLTGDRYLLGSQDYDLLLWDANTGDLISSTEIPNQAEPEAGDLMTNFFNYSTGSAAKIAPISGRLASLGGDNTAIIWDAEWQEPALLLKGHAKSVNSVDWSPDESKLATASLDGTARVWDAQTGEELLKLEGHEGRVSLAIWSPDGNRIATTGQDGSVRVWDSVTGELLRKIEANADEGFSLAWAPNGLRIFSGHGDGSIRIWEVDSGKLLETLRGHQGIIPDLKWAPNEERLASGDSSGFVRIWNAAPSTAWRLLPPQAEQGGTWTVQGVSWSQDGQSLAVAGGDPLAGIRPPLLAVWDLQANQLTREYFAEKFNLQGLSVVFSPDETAMLYQGSNVWPDISPFSTVYAIDSQSGEIIRTFVPGDGKLVRSSAWSPDGSQVATGMFYYGEIDIWDYQTGKLLTTFVHGDPTLEASALNEIEWSSDGSKFASAGDNSECRAWDAHTWDLLFIGKHQPSALCWSVDWSSDGSRLLSTSGNDDSGTSDNAGHIWDGVTGKELLTLVGHTKAVISGEWSPNDKRVATISSDGTARVWDATTGAELLRLTVPIVYFGSVQWSPDGQQLAVVGVESLNTVWNVWQSPEELIAYAKENAVFRELTNEERQQFGLK